MPERNVIVSPLPFKSPSVMPVAHGTDIKGIVTHMYEESGTPAIYRDYRVMVEVNGEPVSRDEWGMVPAKDDHVLVYVPVHGGGGGGGKDPMRTLLTLAVVVTAIAAPWGIAAFTGGNLLTFAGMGAAATTSMYSGIALTSGLFLLDAFCPVSLPSVSQPETASPSYSIAGARNQMKPFGEIPVLLGTEKVFPIVLTQPWIELVGDDEYLRMAFLYCYGRAAIGPLYIGDTPLSSFNNVTQYTYEGLPGDAALALIPYSSHNSPVGVELVYQSPLIRSAPPNVDSLTVQMMWPAGIGQNYGDGPEAWSTYVNIYYKKVTDGGWSSAGVIAVLNIYTTKTIRRAITIPVDRNHDYQVMVQKNTPDGDQTTRWNAVVWVNIQAFRYEDPVTFPYPLAITEIRIKASQQLNGIIDSLNAVCSSYAPIWNGSAWTEEEYVTNNPAALFRKVLTHPANPRPRTAAQIDNAGLGAWYEFCVANGYKFNQYRDSRSSVRATLAAIAFAGRASPAMVNGKWGVIADTGTEPVAQHITPRNSWGFSAEKTFFERPHAFRVRFRNEENNYEWDERIVYDDGYNASNATKFESIEFPGITSPALAWKFGRYHIAQARLRPETYYVYQGWEHLVVRRGSKVRCAYDVPLWGSGWGRVKSVVPLTSNIDFDVVNIRTVNGQAAFGTPLTTDLSAYLDEEIVVSDIALKTATGYLKSVGDKAVHMTYAASGSTGITVADNDNLDFGTGNFTLRWKGALPDWASGTARNLLRKYSTNGYILQISVGNRIRMYLTGASGTKDGTSTAFTFSNGSVHEITVVVTKETPTSNGEIRYYIDGTYLYRETIIANTVGNVDNIGKVTLLGNESALRTAGTVQAATLFNRALTAAEVASLYSSGVAASDQWGSQTAKYTSDCSAGADSFSQTRGTVTGNIDSISDGSISKDDVLRYYADNTASNTHYFAHGGIAYDKKYRVTLNYYIPATNTHVNGFYLRLGNGLFGVLHNTVGAWTSMTEEILSGSGNTVFAIYQTVGSSAIFAGANSVTDDLVYVKDIVITQLGATLDLEPANIGASDWQDSSSNNLDAYYPASGATPVLMHDIVSVSGGATHNWANIEAGFEALQATIYDAVVHDYINAAYTMGVVLDDKVVMAAGTLYGCRFRLPDADNTSLYLSVETVAGETDTLTFSTQIPVADGPDEQDLAMFGEANRETAELLVKEIQRASDYSARLVLVDEAPAIYSADQGPIPPFDPHITRPVDITKIAPGPPVIINIRSGTECLEIFAGGVRTRVFVSLYPPEGNVKIGSYRVRYKSQMEDGYRFADAPPEDMTVILSDVTDGDIYEIAAQAISGYGVASPWSETVQHFVIGQDALPSNVTGFTCNIIDVMAHLSWTAVPDADLSHYRIRWSPSLSGASWANAVDVVDRVGKPATTVTVPAMVGTYFIKAVDFKGLESETAAAVITSIAGVSGLNVVETMTQQPPFGGTGDGVAYVPGLQGLILTSGNDLYDREDLYAASDLYVDGTLRAEGTYLFDDIIDLGDVYTSRVTASIDTNGQNFLLDLYSIEDLYAVNDLYGTQEGSFGVGLEVRTTNDDPAGSPAWGDWKKFLIGDHTTRAYQFRARLRGTPPGTTPILLGVSVTIDMPDRVYRFNADVGVEGATITFTPAFYNVPEIGVTTMETVEGDGKTITNKSRYGFDIAFTNSGVPVARTISGIAVGYGELNT